MNRFDKPRVERMAPVLAASGALAKGTVLSFDTTAEAYVPANISGGKLPMAILLEDVAQSASAVKAKILVEGIVFTDEFNITDPATVAYLDTAGIHVFTRERVPILP